MNEKPTHDYVLPSSIVGRSDLTKLLREIESLEESIEADKVRSKTSHSPKLSQVASDFIEQNDLDLADVARVTALKKHLKTIIERAPNVNMTFASEIDQKNLEKLVDWLRKETHPYALVSVGLQPSLVGGVYLRTPNRVHDFTVKSILHNSSDVLQNELEALQK